MRDVHIAVIVACKFRKVACGAGTDIAKTAKINASPDRQSFSVHNVTAVFKKTLNFFFNGSSIGERGKIVICKTAAVFGIEMLGKKTCNFAQKPVAFPHAVFHVVAFHVVQIEENKRGVFPLLLHSDSAVFRKFEKP